jgi:hypothetical protein
MKDLSVNIQISEGFNNDPSYVWHRRMIWRNQYPVSLIAFAKNNGFDKLKSFSDAKSLWKAINDLSFDYIDFIKSVEPVYTATDLTKAEAERYIAELEDARKEFKGAIGEYFFHFFITEYKTISIKNEHGTYDRYKFKNVAPCIINKSDYGTDLTGICVCLDNAGEPTAGEYKCAIQVKFWNPNGNSMLTYKGVFANLCADSWDKHYAEVDDCKNNIICWLGDDKNISLSLKSNESFKRHGVMIDIKTINSTTGKDIDFWKNFKNKLNDIKNF